MKLEKKGNIMFKEMRKAERKLSAEETEEILIRCQYGILSTTGEDGYPYGTPVNFVFLNQNIYFHCAKDAGQKLENIRYNPKVCFTAVGETELLPEKFSTRYESAVVYGTAKEAEGEIKKEALTALIDKYSSEYKEAGLAYIERAFDKVAVYEITPVQITGKARR